MPFVRGLHCLIETHGGGTLLTPCVLSDTSQVWSALGLRWTANPPEACCQGSDLTHPFDVVHSEHRIREVLVERHDTSLESTYIALW